MADRNERIRLFEETMALCRTHEGLRAAVDSSIREQKIIWQEDPLFVCGPRYAKPAELIISHRRTFEASMQYAKQKKKVCALNFASSVTPGGGVTYGTTAQEESMCRISTLYAAISDQATAGPFYARHWEMIRSGQMGRENRDDCIFTPGVRVIRRDTFDCEMLPEKDWYTVDVLTCAAPDLRYDGNGRTYRPTAAELTAVFAQRWRRVLSVAAEQHAEVLILGAFGCGAFGNPPEVAAKAFADVIDEYRRCFETIEFAVFSGRPDSPNHRAFSGIPGMKEDAQADGEGMATRSDGI